VRELIFVDTESTGLAANPDAEIVELTWCTRTSIPETLFFGVEEVPAFIDNLIGFEKRGIKGMLSTELAFSEFLQASYGNTMVAANPGHDEHFLRAVNLWNFHYRKLDISAYAMAKLRLDQMPGMKDVFDQLNERGYEITEPDHSSLNDVLAMREAFLILERM
jgi:oligoribonuclease (3'-5' exoribonuclease)